MGHRVSFVSLCLFIVAIQLRFIIGLAYKLFLIVDFNCCKFCFRLQIYIL